MPAISVIVACYNQEDYIVECLDSIMAQTFTDFEVIVVNDGSHDKSPQIVADYIKKVPGNKIRLLNQENQGVVAARNNAINMAEGTYILPVDGDDMLTPEALERLYGAMIADRGDVICGVTQFTGARQSVMELPEPSNDHDFLAQNPIICSALYKKSDWVKYNGYDPCMKKGLEDWEFWLNFAEDNQRFHRVNYITYLYRILPSSRNHTIHESTLEELLTYMSTKHEKLVQKRKSLRYCETDSSFSVGMQLTNCILSRYMKSSAGIISTKSKQHADFICGGTLVENMIPDRFMVLLGCGVLPVDNKLPLDKLSVYALRGKLSCKALGITDDIPLGDMALLLPRLFPSTATKPEKNKIIGIIPAVEHADAPELEPYRNHPDYRIINIKDTPQNLTSDITGCTTIISSSLEGIIIADAYKIPNRRFIIPGKPVIGGNYVFDDYYTSIGRSEASTKVLLPHEISGDVQFESSHFSNIDSVQSKLENAVTQAFADMESLCEQSYLSRLNENKKVTHSAQIQDVHEELNTIDTETRMLLLLMQEKEIQRAYTHHRFMAYVTFGKKCKEHKQKRREARYKLMQIRKVVASIIGHAETTLLKYANFQAGQDITGR